MTRKPRHPNLPLLKAGDHVLMGGSYASYPAHWYFASVLWADSTDILLNRSSSNGNTYRQVESVLHVRAVGTVAELSAIKEQARKAVHDLSNTISEAEQTLGSARAALHAELERLALGGLKIIPRDHEAIAESESETRRAIETIDAEESETSIDPAWGNR